MLRAMLDERVGMRLHLERKELRDMNYVVGRRRLDWKRRVRRAVKN